MPNKTEFLALNQWEGSDAVLHTDFNEDNLKLEQAIQSLQQRSNATVAKLDALTDKEAVDYEFLSFALLNALTLTSLESHYPGDKRGLIYDSFVGVSKAELMPEGVHILPQKRYLGLGKSLDEPLMGSQPNGSLHAALANEPWRYFFKQDCCGYLKSFTFYSNFASSATVTINIRKANKELTQAGEQISSETITRAYLSNAGVQTFGFTPVYLTPGDYAIELIPTKGISVSRPLHTFRYDSCARTDGVFTSIAYPFSGFKSGRAKARITHDTGTVGITLIGSDGTRHAMTVCAVEAGMNQEGEACIVTEYELDEMPVSESVQMELAMSSPTEQSMRVFDYGVVFL